MHIKLAEALLRRKELNSKVATLETLAVLFLFGVIFGVGILISNLAH